MNRTPTSIARTAAGDPDRLYARLRREAIDRVRALAGDGWTDFNYSDPGVTILEQLCYALTELPYRASLPLPALLAGPDDARLPLRRQGLVPAPAALTVNPLTPDDLRRLVLDRVPGVANVWFDPVTQGDDRGLYDLTVMPFGDTDADARDRLLRRAVDCYRAHRNLCEDLRSARLLTPVDTLVHAVIDLQDGADPAETLARALYAMGQYLAPEPYRVDLARWRADHPATADLFRGPAMLRGFITDAALAARPAAVRVAALRQLLAETRGVATVEAIEVEVAGEPRRFTLGDTLEAPSDSVFWLRGTTPDRRFTLHLRRDEATVQPNAGRVRRLLDQLWRAHRRTHPMRQEYEAAFGAPDAVWTGLADYAPVGDQFPAVYGVGPAGLPPNASAARRGQAKQLAGYLLPFDQLMADYLGELADLRELFSLDGAGGRPGASPRSLRDVVRGAADLLHPDHERHLAAQADERGTALTRRRGVLDLMLSLYGQDRDFAGEASAGDAAAAAQAIARRERLLRQAARVGRNRCRAADHRRPRSPTNMAGLEAIARILLDLPDPAPAPARPVSDRGTDRVWSAAEDPRDASFGRRLPDAWLPQMERHFARVPPVAPTPDTAATTSPLAGQRVAAPLAEVLGDASRYRIGPADEAAGVYVLCVDRDGGWWWLGEHAGEREALAAVAAMLAAARRRRPLPPPALHLVEWTLLRAARRPDDPGFAFRVTAIVSASREGWTDKAWRHQAETVLRTNAPAHVVLDLRFLDTPELARFERLYADWQATLVGPGADRDSGAAAALLGFLAPAPAGPTPAPSSPKPSSPAPTSPPPSPSPPPAPAPAPVPDPAPDPAPSPPPPPSPPTPVPLPPFIPAPDDDAGALAVSDAEDSRYRADRWTRRMWLWLGRCWALLLPYILALARRRAVEAIEHVPDPPGVPPRAPSAPPEAPVSHPSSSPEPSTQAKQRLVRAASAGARGFDCDTPLDASRARAFAARFAFVVRYLPRGHDGPTTGDLSTDEVGTILDAGLALMLVQHVAPAPWKPSGQLGREQAEAGVAAARAAGVPGGVSLFLDLEGVSALVPATVVEDFCGTWAGFVRTGGYAPGLYVGEACGLDAARLATLPFDTFWRSASAVPSLPVPGYAMVQRSDDAFRVDGVVYDLDEVCGDAHGNTPAWLVLA